MVVYQSCKGCKRREHMFSCEAVDEIERLEAQLVEKDNLLDVQIAFIKEKEKENSRLKEAEKQWNYEMQLRVVELANLHKLISDLKELIEKKDSVIIAAEEHKQGLRKELREKDGEIARLWERENHQCYVIHEQERQIVKLKQEIGEGSADSLKFKKNLSTNPPYPPNYFTEEEMKMDSTSFNLQAILGIQSCKTKEDVVQILEDVRLHERNLFNERKERNEK